MRCQFCGCHAVKTILCGRDRPGADDVQRWRQAGVVALARRLLAGTSTQSPKAAPSPALIAATVALFEPRPLGQLGIADEAGGGLERLRSRLPE